MAGATLAETVLFGAVLSLAASIFVFASLPIAGRLIRRLTGTL